jgi:hypothetical protein
MPIAVSVMHLLSVSCLVYELTASGLFFFGVDGHVNGFDWGFLVVGKVLFGKVRTTRVNCWVYVLLLRCCDESTKSIIKAAQPTYSINPTMGSWVTTCGMDDDGTLYPLPGT